MPPDHPYPAALDDAWVSQLGKAGDLAMLHGKWILYETE